MAEDFKSENPKDSISPEKAGFESNEFKELIKHASHERKNLQLLVEYFEKKSVELEDKKMSFECLFIDIASDAEVMILNRKFGGRKEWTR